MLPSVSTLNACCFRGRQKLVWNCSAYHCCTEAPLLLQAVSLWLQHTSLLGQIAVTIPVPDSLRAVFTTASFAFSSLTSGLLSVDCLLDVGPPGHIAWKRLSFQFAAPLLIFVGLVCIQVFV